MNRHRAPSRRQALRLGLFAGASLFGLNALACSSPTTSAPTAAASPTSAAPTAAAATPTTASGATTPAAASPTAPAATPSAAATAASAANSVDFNALVEAAKSEGQVTYYAANDPSASQRIADAFQAEYGIQVEVVRLASGALAQRYAAEAEAGNVVADVIVISSPTFLDEALQKNWIAAIDGLPALAEWPEQYWDGRIAQIGINTITIAWNTSLVTEEEAPKGWQDVLDPKWKGKILFVDPRTVPAFTGWTLLMQETYGDEFLQKLGEQDLRLVASAVPGAQQLAAGEAHLLVPAIHQVLVPLQSSGAPLADVTPNPTSGVELLGGVSEQAPHPNAARLLFNFLLTREGQQLFNQGGGSSVLSGLQDVVPLPEGYTQPDVRKATERLDELVGLLGIQ